MTTRRLLPSLLLGGLLIVGCSLGFGATLDEATARAAIVQSPDDVLAALVDVETRCHREDPSCLDGVRIVQVLLQRSSSGAQFKAGDRLVLHVGAGRDEGSPSTGDRVLVVGWPLDAKDARSDYTARAMTVAPTRKEIEELRSVIEGLERTSAPRRL
jgi:hypothetical protein